MLPTRLPTTQVVILKKLSVVLNRKVVTIKKSGHTHMHKVDKDAPPGTAQIVWSEKEMIAGKGQEEARQEKNRVAPPKNAEEVKRERETCNDELKDKYAIPMKKA